MHFAGGGLAHPASAWILPAIAALVALAFAIRLARANRAGSIASTFALAHFAASFAAVGAFAIAAFLHREAWVAFENLGGGRVMFLSVYQDLARVSRSGLVFYLVAVGAALLYHRLRHDPDSGLRAGVAASATAFASAGILALGAIDHWLRSFPLGLAVPAFGKFRSPEFLDVADRLFALMTAGQALGLFFTLSVFVFLLTGFRRFRETTTSRPAVIIAGATAIAVLIYAGLLQWDVMRLGKMIATGALPPSW
jgi:hypothetical protein